MRASSRFPYWSASADHPEAQPFLLWTRSTCALFRLCLLPLAHFSISLLVVSRVSLETGTTLQVVPPSNGSRAPSSLLSVHNLILGGSGGSEGGGFIGLFQRRCASHSNGDVTPKLHNSPQALPLFRIPTSSHPRDTPTPSFSSSLIVSLGACCLMMLHPAYYMIIC